MKASFMALLFGTIIMGSVGQILLKRGMKNIIVKFSLKTIIIDVIKMYLNLFVMLGTLVYATSTILWIAVLSKVELSYAYPMVSLNFVIVAILSKIFFKEKVSRIRWVSIFIIVFGVALLSIS